MMMQIVIGELTKKLLGVIEEGGGKTSVDATWTNDWLAKNKAPFMVRIVDENGKEISGAKVVVTKKGGA